MKELLSWGRYPVPHAQDCLQPGWKDEVQQMVSSAHGPLLPRGLGRSYGDSCLVSSGSALLMTALKRWLSFDEQTGVLRIEAGASFAEVIPLLVERGWFLPVSPGTLFVTFGGAVANDIHGKNHHTAGTFGKHVRAFELVRSGGEVVVCSPTDHMELFNATIGGLGLTGVITWVEVQLIRIHGSMMDVCYTAFDGIEAFLALSDRSTARYTVAWLDTTTDVPRGIFMEGEHAPSGAFSSRVSTQTWLRVPFDAPAWLLAPWSMKLFNIAYYYLQRLLPAKRRVGLVPFFAPLDGVRDWNRLYGSRGFIQYQFVVPTDAANRVVSEVLRRLRRAGHLSFLTVLKKFGDIQSPGWLSFPRAGVTLALDVPCAPGLMALLDELDQLVLSEGGRFYPAKDAHMSGEVFREAYPLWTKLEALRDPAIRSDFWKRVTH